MTAVAQTPLEKTIPPLDHGATALFLDVDGTLAPFERHPAAVGPTPRRTAVVKAVSLRLGGRLAAISGRSIDEVDRILGGATPAVAGLHGLERRDANQRVHRIEPHPEVDRARRRLAEITHRRAGVIIEAKGASVALHYRSRPDLAVELIAAVRMIGRDTGLEFRTGAMVVELRTPGPHKGDAVTAFMAEAPFRGAYPIYVGDDLTDEDGFATARRLGGFGVLVGDREGPTHAAYRLDGVDAVLAWLEAQARPLDQDRPHAA